MLVGSSRYLVARSSRPEGARRAPFSVQQGSRIPVVRLYRRTVSRSHLVLATSLFSLRKIGQGLRLLLALVDDAGQDEKKV